MNIKIKSISIILLLLLACNTKKNNFDKELNKEKLVKQELKKLNISIKIPKRHQLFLGGQVVTIRLNPQRRNAKQFSIVRANSNIQKMIYKDFFEFDNGTIINYNTFTKSGGSGGAEYVLEGIFKLENEQFLITSIDQKEFNKGKPEFCLKYLSTIEKMKNNVTQTISTDIDSLSKLLNLTIYKPIMVKYKYPFIDNSGKNDRISIPSPSDYYLEALIYFDSLTFSKINDSEKELEFIKQNHKKEEFNFEWLSSEVKNELMQSDLEYHGHSDLFFGKGVHRKSWYLKNKILIRTSSI